MHVMEKRRILKKLKHRILFEVIFVFGVLGFLSVLAADAYFHFHHILHTMLPYVSHAVIFFWLLIIFSGLCLNNQICPLCNNRFTVNSMQSTFNAFTFECMNCGLRQGGKNIEQVYEGKAYIRGDGFTFELLSGKSIAFYGFFVFFLGILFDGHAFSKYFYSIGAVVSVIGVVAFMFEIGLNGGNN